jgi:hypothetical protein
VLASSAVSEGKRTKSGTKPPEPPRTITPSAPAQHPIGTPRGLSTHAGTLAVGGWLAARGLFPPTNRTWRVDIALDVIDRPTQIRSTACTALDTRFQIAIELDAWRYMFCHKDRTSTIHIAASTVAHDRDEHRLLAQTTTLKGVGTLIRSLEQRYQIYFQRAFAAIRSEIPGSEPMIRAWVLSL